jgi:hypothetical protein
LKNDTFIEGGDRLERENRYKPYYAVMHNVDLPAYLTFLRACGGFQIFYLSQPASGMAGNVLLRSVGGIVDRHEHDLAAGLEQRLQEAFARGAMRSSKTVACRLGRSISDVAHEPPVRCTSRAAWVMNVRRPEWEEQS